MANDNMTGTGWKYALLTVAIGLVLFLLPTIFFGEEIKMCDRVFAWYPVIRVFLFIAYLYACYRVSAGRDDDSPNEWRMLLVLIAIIYAGLTMWTASQYRQDNGDNIAPVSYIQTI